MGEYLPEDENIVTVVPPVENMTQPAGSITEPQAESATQPAGSITEPQVEDTIQPAESYTSTEPQVAEESPSSKPISPGNTGEMSAVKGPEFSKEQTREIVDKLIDRARKIPGGLAAGNTPEDHFDLVQGMGFQGSPALMHLTHEVKRQDGNIDIFSITCSVDKNDPGNSLTFSKHIKAADNDMRTLEAGWERGSNVPQGKLVKTGDTGREISVKLNPNQTQQTLEVVLGNLQTTVEAREAGGTLVTDAEVAEILGQNQPTPEV
jgi:hypothetical protein